MTFPMTANYSLKEDIRDYWAERSKTFDLAFGHAVGRGAEFEAWRAAVSRHLGQKPLDVLELACGTGEITGVLASLGHRVIGLDFCEPMLERARAKHRGDRRVRLRLGDAEHTLEPDGAFEAVVCRHLVWTLTDPAAALADWHRVLRPGGHLLVFDGNWATPCRTGRLARRGIGLLDRLLGADAGYDHPGLADRHAEIMASLPFGDGLTFDRLKPLAEAAGFVRVERFPHAPIAAAQRRGASLRNRLRTLVYDRFVLHARKA
jgi:SAM-dependent methyltransferase